MPTLQITASGTAASAPGTAIPLLFRIGNPSPTSCGGGVTTVTINASGLPPGWDLTRCISVHVVLTLDPTPRAATPGYDSGLTWTLSEVDGASNRGLAEGTTGCLLWGVPQHVSWGGGELSVRGGGGELNL